MKKLTLFFLVFYILGCSKPGDLTIPSILVIGNLVALDTLHIQISESINLDGIDYSPEFYNWQIKIGTSDSVVYTENGNNAEFDWVPQEGTTYIITLTMGYDENKTVTTLTQINIREGPSSFSKRLIGSWTGHVSTMFGAEWDIQLMIEDGGHYTGYAYNWTNPQYMYTTLFYYGDEDDLDLDYDKFLISNVNIDNIGDGEVWSAWGGGNSTVNNQCFHDMKFTDDYSTLTFTLKPLYECFDQWYENVVMYRQ